jgi:flagellin
MSVINTNIQALTAARTLDRNQELLGRSLGRLSSGSKIVKPSDDPAGLAVSEKINAENQRVNAAANNVQNAVSYVQTSDSFMNGMGKMLSRMSELAILAKDSTKGTSDIAVYQQEFQSLQDQLRTTIGGSTAVIGGTTPVTSPFGSFNGISLFGSTAGGGTTVDIGSALGQTMTIPDTDLTTGPMLVMFQQDSSGAYTFNSTDSTAVTKISDAMQALGIQRATLGAAESSLNLAATTLQVEGQNFASALSNIRDVDVAQESTDLAKYNILAQAGTAMLVQANQTPQSVLKLLQS